MAHSVSTCVPLKSSEHHSQEQWTICSVLLDPVHSVVYTTTRVERVV